jgi:hypothetical protein
MKAFNELILLVYWNGYVEAYNKIDRYWDNLEQICLSRNLDKNVVINTMSKDEVSALEWPSSSGSCFQQTFFVHTLNAKEYLYG